MDNQNIVIRVATPEDAKYAIAITDEMTRTVEDRITKSLAEDMDIVESILTQIGEGTADPNGFPEPGASPNKARLTVTFVAEEKRNGKSTKSRSTCSPNTVNIRFVILWKTIINNVSKIRYIYSSRC